jgi:glycerol kinase
VFVTGAAIQSLRAGPGHHRWHHARHHVGAPAHATLDAIAVQVRDVVDLLTHDALLPPTELAVGGVVAASDVLCQIQADQLGRPVVRPEIIETTGLGAGGPRRARCRGLVVT